ncbi:hypothetical protein WN51_04398 [Melipona quadrifasciata]|uniref:Uncharacterized protein n=1 Tax=Melipona quadrifasciata TaxID=166423 RepID=A0A0N0U4B9_9HYME|nr:hypothetical protein WN51_04398 [Melipona quadrifasciata]
MNVQTFAKVHKLRNLIDSSTNLISRHNCNNPDVTNILLEKYIETTINDRYGKWIDFRCRYFSIEVRLLFVAQVWAGKFGDRRRRAYGALIESYDLAARLVYASVKDMKQLGFKRGFVGDYPGLGRTLHDAWIFADQLLREYERCNFLSKVITEELSCDAAMIILYRARGKD